MLDFRILGPIEVWRDGRPVRISGRKVRAVLAALLLRADHVVRTDRLIEALWGDEPPPTASAQLHKYVSQLRGELGQDLIVRHGDGYRLRLGRHQLDLHVFDRMVRSARAFLAADRQLEAAEELTAALALWRGQPIVDATEELIRSEAPALAERRMAALLDKIEIELALGRHAELVAELQALVAEHPLHEKLRCHLMLALYRSGRVAEALAAYHDGRMLLVEELGVEPGADLRHLHEAILAADPGLEYHGRRGGPARGYPSPAQLPPSISDFVGRSDEIETISATLTRGDPDAPAIVAISGKGGVGKTTLAVRAARRVVDHFPDGQLYVRLRGPGARPTDPLVALQRFLRALGMEDWAIPDDVDECAQLFRSRSASRRLLVFLDDAVDEAQVRALLPGSPNCAVLVTSRARLRGLAGTRFLDLDVFRPEESLALLEHVIGPRRVGGQRAIVRRIAQLCGHLPLAVRIAAARCAQQPGHDLVRFAHRLADERRRLDVLVAGDLEVRAGLTISYRGLGPQEREAFALLGLLDAPDFAAWVVAPLLDVTLTEAEDIVEELVNAHLLDIVGYDATGQIRYRYHDLVRLYARERAEAEYPEHRRRNAIARALGAWLTLAAEAGERFHGTRSRGWSPRSFAESAYYNPFAPADVDELLASPLWWFEAERPALVTNVAQACAYGLSSLAWALAESVGDFLELRHHDGDWERSHTLALQACTGDRNLVGTAVMLTRLARLRFIRREQTSSLSLTERALAITRDLGLKALEAEIEIMYAAALRAAGEHEHALQRINQALLLARAAGNAVAEARATRELGTIRYEQAQWDWAADSFQVAVRLARRLDNRREAAMSLRSLAVVLRHLGQLEEARRLAETALAAFRELGDRPYEAFSCLTLGLTLLRLGDRSARRYVEEGERLLRETNPGYGVGEALYVRAELDLADGRAEAAANCLVECIEHLGTEPVHHMLISAVALLARALHEQGEDAAAEAVERQLPDLSARLGRRLPASARKALSSALPASLRARR
jgi:DNA-binding transcriptional activator of the SARP family